jgi:hypothetical protein
MSGSRSRGRRRGIPGFGQDCRESTGKLPLDPENLDATIDKDSTYPKLDVDSSQFEKKPHSEATNQSAPVMLFVSEVISRTTYITSLMVINASFLVSWVSSANAADPTPAQDKIILPVRVATLHGNGAQLDGTLIENWDDVGTFVSWRVRLNAGELEVLVRQASGSASAGNSYQIEIADQTLSGTVRNTGGWRMIEDKGASCHESGRSRTSGSGGQKVRAHDPSGIALR